MSALLQIEKRRVELGIGKQYLTTAAGVSQSAYSTALRDGVTMQASNVARLKLALSRLSGNHEDLSDERIRLALACFMAVLAYVCTSRGYDFGIVSRLPPNDRSAAGEWKTAAMARQLSYYLTSAGLGISQTQLGKATGVSRAAVCQAIQNIGLLSDDDAALEEWLELSLDQLPGWA